MSLLTASEDPRRTWPSNEEPFPETIQRDEQGQPMRRYSVKAEMADARPPKGSVVPRDNGPSPYAIALAALVLLALIVVVVFMTGR